VWVRSVRCPTALIRVAGVLASASLYIYLTHFEVYLPLREKYPWPAFALSLLAGVIYWQTVTFTVRLLATVSRTRMSPRRMPRTAVAPTACGPARCRHSSGNQLARRRGSLPPREAPEIVADAAIA